MGVVCSRAHPCNVCSDWSDAQWAVKQAADTRTLAKRQKRLAIRLAKEESLSGLSSDVDKLSEDSYESSTSHPGCSGPVNPGSGPAGPARKVFMKSSIPRLRSKAPNQARNSGAAGRGKAVMTSLPKAPKPIPLMGLAHGTQGLGRNAALSMPPPDSMVVAWSQSPSASSSLIQRVVMKAPATQTSPTDLSEQRWKARFMDFEFRMSEKITPSVNNLAQVLAGMAGHVPGQFRDASLSVNESDNDAKCQRRALLSPANARSGKRRSRSPFKVRPNALGSSRSVSPTRAEPENTAYIMGHGQMRQGLPWPEPATSSTERQSDSATQATIIERWGQSCSPATEVETSLR